MLVGAVQPSCESCSVLFIRWEFDTRITLGPDDHAPGLPACSARSCPPLVERSNGEVPPHSEVKFRSPREFIGLSA